MSDLLSLLSRSAASLGAHRTASSTAASNIENANTPGYARQRAELGSVPSAERYGVAFLGGGAAVLGVSQARDRFLEAQLPGALGAEARTSAEASALEAFTALDNDAPGNLASALADFYGGLRALSQSPSDSTLRQAAIQGASAFVQSLHATATAVATSRKALDQQATGYLSEVNSLARQMADLNGRIRTARASGAEPNDLLDARLRVQDRLSALTGATPVPDASGDQGLALPGGLSLVSGDRAATLSALPDPGNGGLVRFQLVRSDGTGPIDLPTSSLGGALGGILDAREGALARVAAGLDTLAFDLAGAVNQVHRAGVGLDGVGNRALFAVSGDREGAALALEVDPEILADPRRLAAASSTDGLPGGATNLFALIATEEAPLSDGLDAVASLASLVSGFGTAASRARAAADQNGALRENLSAMRDSASGVSIDEELIEMTKAQRAYEAVSKVIVATDEMLETLINLR